MRRCLVFLAMNGMILACEYLNLNALELEICGTLGKNPAAYQTTAVTMGMFDGERQLI